MINNSASSLVLRVFLKIFVPVVLFMAGISLAYYLSEARENIQALKQQDKLHIELQTVAFRHEFQSIISDLMVLSAHQQLRLIVDGFESVDYAALANEFLAFCKNKKMYDQVRYLDATGMEIVRVNFSRGHAAIVPAAQLQAKGERYYFRDTFRLDRGQIFVSPFDLNVEGGAIERPLKPTIRFGIPIFNSRGEKRGIIVLNYFGKQLIEHLEQFTRLSLAPSFDMLLNSDGYFLNGMRRDDEWGFMFPERKDKTFAQLFPTQRDNIMHSSSGQFRDHQGLFTFTSVFPLSEGLKSSSGSSEILGSSLKKLDANQYSWKIVSFTPHDSILGMTRELRVGLLFMNASFVLLIGVGAWYLARAMVRRQVVEDKIEHMAHFDLLTELPNRPLLYDRLGMALANAHRGKNILAVFFLDLDGFKGVNDSHGHEAGDQILIEVARRLEQCVRETDSVARIGGDEFVLVLTSITEPEAAEMIAKKVLARLAKPIIFNNESVTIGASIGIAFYPKDASTQDALLSKADAAMYSAKENGKNHYRFCS
ncbi:MAG: sensor domain-containing diguanylate cyclase [Mariprofundus sp.]|nr:sensor domain-containing diguanylate cyclase [Mariprofundus sp.]